MNYDYIFKYIIVGDSGVGKSCMLLRFVDGRYATDHDITIGVEFGTKIVSLKDKNIKIQIWDTAGQEYFKSITRAYYRDSAGVILVYDITNRQSFDNAKEWLDDIKNLSNSSAIILVGNKIDIDNERKVSYEDGEKFANENNIQFMEVSVKNNNNINSVFMTLADIIIDKINNNNFNVRSMPNGIVLKTNKSDDTCCKKSDNDNSCCHII